MVFGIPSIHQSKVPNIWAVDHLVMGRRVSEMITFNTRFSNLRLKGVFLKGWLHPCTSVYLSFTATVNQKVHPEINSLLNHVLVHSTLFVNISGSAQCVLLKISQGQACANKISMAICCHLLFSVQRINLETWHSPKCDSSCRVDLWKSQLWCRAERLQKKPNYMMQLTSPNLKT